MVHTNIYISTCFYCQYLVLFTTVPRIINTVRGREKRRATIISEKKKKPVIERRKNMTWCFDGLPQRLWSIYYYSSSSACCTRDFHVGSHRAFMLLYARSFVHGPFMSHSRTTLISMGLQVGSHMVALAWAHGGFLRDFSPGWDFLHGAFARSHAAFMYIGGVYSHAFIVCFHGPAQGFILGEVHALMVLSLCIHRGARAFMRRFNGLFHVGPKGAAISHLFECF